MQVKWGWVRPGSMMTFDWGVISSVYDGSLGRMWNYDKTTGPKGNLTDGYSMPPGQDVVVIGGRDSIDEAMRSCGPHAWNSKAHLRSFGAYRGSGSVFKPNLTLLLVTTSSNSYSGLKPGPSFDIKFAENNFDIDRYFIPAGELREFVKTLK